MLAPLLGGVGGGSVHGEPALIALKNPLSSGARRLKVDSHAPWRKPILRLLRSVKSKFPFAIMLPHTRREFAKLSLAVLPGGALLSAMNRLGAAESPGKPNSKVAGVQVGLNVPYSFANPSMSGDDILKNCLRLGLSAVELRTQPVEAFLGVPANLIKTKTSEPSGSSASNAEQLRNWRKSVSMDRVAEFRKQYEAAGVLIEIVKVDGIFKMT